MTQVPFAPDVFTWPSDEPQLIGGRCTACGSITFPAWPSCSRCGSVDVEQHLLPRRGTVWTWTTQEFFPKEPYNSGETQETFQPFGIAMVQLDDEVKVEGRLTVADADAIDFGMPVELVVYPFRTEADGTEVMSYAFAPVSDNDGGGVS